MAKVNLAAEAKRLAQAASAAAGEMAQATPDVKSCALKTMAGLLRKKKSQLQAANKKDLSAGRKAALSSAMIDRLTLSGKRIEAMASSLEEIAELPDPVGEMIDGSERPGGFRVDRVRVPLGVVLAIYEARPNVTSDIAGLCLKASNAVILRGGREAVHSNRAVHKLLVEALKDLGLPADAVQLVKQTDRELVGKLLKLHALIDLVIPRGGEGLIRAVARQSTIPVIKHYKGVCHIYVDEFADLPMAHAIAMNAKVQRPGVCNAMETLLVHEAVAGQILPKLCKDLVGAGVEVRGCPKTR
ncbi:MAG: glutamate-5-semialdehyde dehydrogenase, partial [Phycisphaerae bacterium]|nr:glutamate-5-semialdehyde dehydrogenase [Phycisphaerae bacterium]